MTKNYVAGTNITDEEWVAMLEKWPEALTSFRHALPYADLELFDEHYSQFQWGFSKINDAYLSIKKSSSRELQMRLAKAHCRIIIPAIRLLIALKFS